jgi:hypothetical protein
MPTFLRNAECRVWEYKGMKTVINLKPLMKFNDVVRSLTPWAFVQCESVNEAG